MAIIDRVKYDGPPNILIWRHPPDDLTWGTQLIVNETQEAIFLKGGQILDVLGPGTHTLKTANIPLLRGLIKVPFGGETPFAAEIYFVNKAVHLDAKWGTLNPIPLLDPLYKVPLPVRAYGQFGIRIADSRKVFTQLSSTRQELTVEGVVEAYKAILMTRIKDYIAETMIKQKLSFLEVSAHLEELSEAIKGKLSGDFSKYGIELANFFVGSVDVPEEDDSVKRLKKALSEKAEMEILGDGYKTKRTFDTLEKAAGNEGGGGAGAGMGLGMGVGMGAGMGQLMGQALGAAAQTGTKCKCGTGLPSGAKFCPSCGEKTGS